MRRRALLAGTGCVFPALVAGCLQNLRPSEKDTDESAGSGPNTGKNEMDGLIQFSASSSADWYTDGDPQSGYIELYGSRDAAFDSLDFEAVRESRRAEVESFVEETPFDSTAILYIASVGSHGSFSTISIDQLEVDDGVVRGIARAKQPPKGQGGGEDYRYPSALVRVSGESEPPERAEITVIDGWGDESALVAELQR